MYTGPSFVTTGRVQQVISINDFSATIALKTSAEVERTAHSLCSHCWWDGSVTMLARVAHLEKVAEVQKRCLEEQQRVIDQIWALLTDSSAVPPANPSLLSSSSVPSVISCSETSFVLQKSDPPKTSNMTETTLDCNATLPKRGNASQFSKKRKSSSSPPMETKSPRKRSAISATTIKFSSSGPFSFVYPPPKKWTCKKKQEQQPEPSGCGFVDDCSESIPEDSAEKDKCIKKDGNSLEKESTAGHSEQTRKEDESSIDKDNACAKNSEYTKKEEKNSIEKDSGENRECIQGEEEREREKQRNGSSKENRSIMTKHDPNYHGNYTDNVSGSDKCKEGDSNSNSSRFPSNFSSTSENSTKDCFDSCVVPFDGVQSINEQSKKPSCNNQIVIPPPKPFVPPQRLKPAQSHSPKNDTPARASDHSDLQRNVRSPERGDSRYRDSRLYYRGSNFSPSREKREEHWNKRRYYHRYDDRTQRNTYADKDRTYGNKSSRYDYTSDDSYRYRSYNYPDKNSYRKDSSRSFVISGRGHR